MPIENIQPLLRALEKNALWFFNRPENAASIQPWQKICQTGASKLGKEINPDAPWLLEKYPMPDGRGGSYVATKPFDHSSIDYGLFYNSETRQYLTTCRDARRPIYQQDYHNPTAVIEWGVLDIEGPDDAQALKKAYEIWTAHLDYLTRSFPNIDRNNVDHDRRPEYNELLKKFDLQRSGRPFATFPPYNKPASPAAPKP